MYVVSCLRITAPSRHRFISSLVKYSSQGGDDASARQTLLQLMQETNTRAAAKLQKARDPSKIDEKLHILQKHGVELEDICRHSKLITDMSVANLQNRVEEMYILGYEQPLPAKILAAPIRRSLAPFMKYSSQERDEARQARQKLLQMMVEINAPAAANLQKIQDYSKIDEKLLILMKQGVELEDICRYSRVITEVSVANLQKRVEEMYALGYEQPLPAKILAAASRPLFHALMYRDQPLSEKANDINTEHRRVVIKQNSEIINEKLEFLQQHQVALDDIHRHSRLLCYSLALLKKRADAMYAVGFVKPLPANVLAAPSWPQFRTLLNRPKAQEMEDRAKQEFLLKAEEKRLWLSRPARLLSASKLASKINYLESKGFHFEDIVSHMILRLKLENIQEAYTTLQKFGFEDVRLSTIHKYAQQQRINSGEPTRLARVAFILGVDVSIIRSTIPASLRTYFAQQKTAAYVENLATLEKFGFKRETIANFSIILCHNSNILRRHLKGLKDRAELEHLPEILSDEAKLLNALQFFIEKERNFSQPVVQSEETGSDEDV